MGGEAVDRADMEGVDCVVSDVVCDDLAAEGNITSPLPSGDTFQLVDEFIEEEREEVNDPLENEGEDTLNDAEEANDDEVVNDELGVKEEEFEEEALEEVKQEELEDTKDGGVEEMKEEDVEEVDESQEGMDESPEEIDQ